MKDQLQESLRLAEVKVYHVVEGFQTLLTISHADLLSHLTLESSNSHCTVQAPALYVLDGQYLEPFAITQEVEALGVRMLSTGDLEIDFSKAGIS